MILPLESDLKPVITKKAWKQINNDPEWQDAERIRCADEPWYWLANWVYTIRRDENVEDAEITRFPADEYLRYVFHKIFTEPFLAVDKSRQMRLTLLLMAWSVWHCQFRENEQIVCQSQKRDDAHDELLEQRAYVIWKYQPDWLKPRAILSQCKLKFPPTNGIINGMPLGDKASDQIRSKTPTKTILDEGGFYKGQFEKCLAAALACCKNIKVVSTANTGEWDDFINDKVAA